MIMYNNSKKEQPWPSDYGIDLVNTRSVVQIPVKAIGDFGALSHNCSCATIVKSSLVLL